MQLKKVIFITTLLLFSTITKANYNPNNHYATQSQITPANIKHLKLAWIYHYKDKSTGKNNIAPTAAEATPVFANNLLYTCTPYDRVLALNPGTGKPVWMFNPQINIHNPVIQGGLMCRGVAVWQSRVFLATHDGRLIALNAKTGKQIKSFGHNGEINLKTGVLFPITKQLLTKHHVPLNFFNLIKKYWAVQVGVTSAPVVINNLVVVGMSLDDNFMSTMPSGVVRAYNATTGKLAWQWNPVPASMRQQTGAINVWAPFTADAKNNLVIVGTSSPSPDYYGVLRQKKMPYANAVVALNATTGKPVWHFQTVHHDLFDYDIASKAALGRIVHDGKSIPVAIQATKTGFVFVLNRLTGKPVFPVVERKVPASTVPNEHASSTQPEPILPKPLITTVITKEQIWGLTPIDRAWCMRQFKQYRSEGLFTPISLQGTVEFPFTGGGINWGGVAFDPANHILIVNYSRIAQIVKLIPRAKANKIGYVGTDVAPMFGTPYALMRKPFISPVGVPCTAPPWGMLAAINLDTGKVIWKQPFGSVKKMFFTSFKRWGSPNMGGALITNTGLVFIGASMDKLFHAYDLSTGKLLWQTELPAQGAATPMSYFYKGKQYIVINAGGGRGSPANLLGDAFVAFSL